MKKSFNKLFLTSVTVLGLTSFVMVAVDEAYAAARGGAGARASAGGAGNREVNSGNRDARANNVRNTSVNNVSNTTVVVSGNNNRNNGWDHDHPVARAAVVTGAIAVTAAAIGSMVNTVPPGCVPVNYGGMVYQQCGTVWYQPQGSQFVVVNPPY
jgi:hypothetical protein